MPRKIIHIDMDAFYASVEQRDHPPYRGQPIVVGGRPEQRGAVAAASYEARRYGIHSAMPARVAAQRCPQLIFVRPRFDAYRGVSQQICEIFQRYTDLVEPLSLDEAYLDVTENKLGLTSATAIAHQIKQDILNQTQLTASAGVSINKFLAKIASDLDKPNGLHLITPAQAEAFVEGLPIQKFHGIGPATARKMSALGIHIGADLKQWPESELTRHFGKAGRFYYKVARAQDDRPVNPNRIRKSVGAEQSFAEDLRDLAQMREQLSAIAQTVKDRLDRHQRYGHTLTLKVKYASYQQMTRSCTLTELFNNTALIYDTAERLLQLHLDRQQAVRLLGISISNLAQEAKRIEHLQLALPLASLI